LIPKLAREREREKQNQKSGEKENAAAIHRGYSKYTCKIHNQFQKTPNSNQLNPTAKSLQYNNVLRTKNEKMGTSSSNSPPPQPAL
jgi:hypothetical protein